MCFVYLFCCNFYVVCVCVCLCITEGLPDPFAKVVVEDSGQCHCTEPLKATLDPKWNQHYDL